ncbi:FAD/NAD(P)-binding protein [Rufibacter glacialis]|uniref:FAD/NAD(P)-binding protein n=1 Tax=Rufibacter glacialis TaxID=1259555 RepID=A0A5M8QMK6_9BACT|nr:FAD/NAD(P)-binding protein [Rufibacter glacialis]KAA6437375.1 hypothetical protein FOE74_02425 [Rufibacter glacialis]GGK59793.1 hypothetical protein GCM10011405_04920 [Rufibacter glacialis]
MRHVIAIIGGGFSGTMVAVHLLRQQQCQVEVVLLNEGYPTGKGIAYSADQDTFLLNVHAGRMSALPDEPNHFVEWLLQEPAYAGHTPEELAVSFMPRQLYGRYLHQLLSQAIARPAGKSTCQVVEQRVEDLRHTPGAQRPFHLRLKTGETVSADQVVLALGNFLPAPLRCVAAAPPLPPHLYEANPWKPEAWQNLPPAPTLLLIGTGLTSIDIILALLTQNFTGKITAVSTNGYLPFPYQTPVPDLAFSARVAQATTLLEVLRHFKTHLRQAEPGHWENLVNGLRSQTQDLWKRFSCADKIRFSKKLGSLWAVVRHRLPPQVHQRIQEAIAEGILEIVPGQIEAVTSHETGVQVQVKTSRGTETRWAHRVLNCTGPQLNYAAIPDPLVRSLLAQKLISPHPMGMGLETDGLYQVRQPGGSVTPGLFTLGASLRGELWESNAVPELREQAQELAAHLLASFQGVFPEKGPKTQTA